MSDIYPDFGDWQQRRAEHIERRRQEFARKHGLDVQQARADFAAVNVVFIPEELTNPLDDPARLASEYSGILTAYRRCVHEEGLAVSRRQEAEHLLAEAEERLRGALRMTNGDIDVPNSAEGVA